jgi:hypothetical protein
MLPIARLPLACAGQNQADQGDPRPARICLNSKACDDISTSNRRQPKRIRTSFSAKWRKSAGKCPGDLTIPIIIE